MIDTSDIPEAGEEFFKKAVLSYGPPIRLGDGPGGVIKVKRGGTGKISNSGNAPKRFYTAVKGLRHGKKPGKPGGGTLLPKPPASPPIWGPRDPFIIAYQQAHPRIEAAWRRCPVPVIPESPNAEVAQP